MHGAMIKIDRNYFKHSRRRSRFSGTHCHICTAVSAKPLMKPTLISEELGISLSSLNVIVSNWLIVEPERERSQQQNIGK
jgi:hypothetical protein